MADAAYDADHLREAIPAKGTDRRHPEQSVMGPIWTKQRRYVLN